MKHFVKVLYVTLLVLMTTSCKRVLEYPSSDVEPVDPTLVALDVNIEVSISAYLEFELYAASTKSVSGSESEVTAEDCYLRTIIELYAKDDLSTPLITETLYNSYSEIEDLSINFEAAVAAEEYTMAIWCDLVQGSDAGDNYFYTGSTLSQVKYLDPYVGNTLFKSAFSDVVDIDLTMYQDRWYGECVCDVELERPQAMFEIITTDLEKFIDEQDGGAIESAVDYSKYSVEVTYEGYMPYGYNVLTDKPNEAQQGVSYVTNLEILSATEARLAFDYVFVNHAESGVNISLVVYDESGDVVAEIASQTIAISRNKKSVITGEFLTSDYAPGIGIDPSFDGEYNVVIPD